MFQAIFLIFKEFHFRSLKSTTISTLFINAGPIKCPHSVQCFGWLWHWFDFRPNFHFSFLMCMIKLSRIGPTQRADRSFFNIISCSFVLKKSFTPRMMLFTEKTPKTHAFQITIIQRVNIKENEQKHIFMEINKSFLIPAPQTMWYK